MHCEEIEKKILAALSASPWHEDRLDDLVDADSLRDEEKFWKRFDRIKNDLVTRGIIYRNYNRIMAMVGDTRSA